MSNGFIKLHGGPDGDAFLVNPAKITAIVPRSDNKPGSIVCMGWTSDQQLRVRESVEDIEAKLKDICGSDDPSTDHATQHQSISNND